jgi:endo-1,4-beta-D-glucanase Y
MRLSQIMVPVILGFGLSAVCAQNGGAASWSQWNRFADRFVQADGRVIDLTFDRKSTSEGQSYGLFFALVANDRARFDEILKWTSNNLAGGRLGERLPAWLWGQRQDASWGVKDENSAADADLWLAYTLLEASRLWGVPAYADLGRKLLGEINRREVAAVAGVGTVLLPGPEGFRLDHGRVRLNPSYMPRFMFRYLAAVDAPGPWQRIWDDYMRWAPAVFRSGVAPDLFVVDSSGVVHPDTERAPAGSYDAIRVYLWEGMSSRSDKRLIALLPTYASLTRERGTPPEKVDPVTAIAATSSFSPIGFSGAVLPYLSTLNDQATLGIQRGRVRDAATRARLGQSTNYYDQALILFGEGWLDGRYRFDDEGRLQPSWMP